MGVATAALIVAGVTAAASATANAIKANKAKKESEKQNDIKDAKEQQLADLEANRQEIVNPYADVTTAPFDNMGVATQAAEFQAEEADIALANTLDTLRATGAGAGGATALAQAALQSKRGISADIQKQESGNQKMRAEAAMKAAEMKGHGEKFVTGMQEDRENQQLNRVAGQMDNAEARAAQADAAKTEAQMGMVMSVAEGAQTYASLG